tara:strand:- start:298 stop:423 length:126 start_codon:yes stop_codon:yes gene_type:complete
MISGNIVSFKHRITQDRFVETPFMILSLRLEPSQPSFSAAC